MGSEMCIRDSPHRELALSSRSWSPRPISRQFRVQDRHAPPLLPRARSCCVQIIYFCARSGRVLSLSSKVRPCCVRVPQIFVRPWQGPPFFSRARPRRGLAPLFRSLPGSSWCGPAVPLPPLSVYGPVAHLPLPSMNGSAVTLSSREAHGTAAQHPVISVCGHAASLPTCYVDGTAVDSTSRPVHGAAAHLPARLECASKPNSPLDQCSYTPRNCLPFRARSRRAPAPSFRTAPP